MTFKTMNKLYRMLEREIEDSKRTSEHFDKKVKELRKDSDSCWDESQEIKKNVEFREEARNKLMELTEMLEDMEKHEI